MTTRIRHYNNCPGLAQPSFEIRQTMDLCNVYVKGIPSNISNPDLFNLFKPFGRIISSKVIHHQPQQASPQKKGFGFVSYSNSIETARAIIAIHTQNVYGIAVQFHEPKVPRKEHNFDQQLALLGSCTDLSSHFYLRVLDSNNMNTIVPLIQWFCNNASSYSYYPQQYWTNHQKYVTYSPPIGSQEEEAITGNNNSRLLDMLNHCQINLTPTQIELVRSELKKLDPSEQAACLNDVGYLRHILRALLPEV